jgi:DNA-binding CsgD family transcriptional regulator
MDLSDYVNAVCEATSPEALDAILLKMMDDRGVAAVSGYAFPFGGDVTTIQKPIITSWPPEVRNAYRSDMAGEDPIMYASMTLGVPVHFLEIYPSLSIDGKGERVLDVMRAAGFRDAVTTPVYAKPGAFAYFVAAFREERHDMTVAEMRRIKLMFTEYYVRYLEIARIEGAALSDRERQVLVAMVANKTNSEIAAMLGVSEHTVGTYVRRCFGKLDVNSRTQAVLRYLGGGALDLSA